MKQIKVTDRLRYAFDNTMAKGTAALIGWLALACVVFILIVASVIFFAGLTITPTRPDGLSFPQIAWLSLMHAFNPAVLAAETGSTAYLSALLVLAIGGILLMSTLIGLTTSAVREKAVDLRKGHSFVVERDHTVILGWSPQIFTILAELIQANLNQPRSCIVILANMDKVEM